MAGRGPAIGSRLLCGCNSVSLITCPANGDWPAKKPRQQTVSRYRGHFLDTTKLLSANVHLATGHFNGCGL